MFPHDSSEHTLDLDGDAYNNSNPPRAHSAIVNSTSMNSANPTNSNSSASGAEPRIAEPVPQASLSRK